MKPDTVSFGTGVNSVPLSRFTTVPDHRVFSARFRNVLHKKDGLGIVPKHHEHRTGKGPAVINKTMCDQQFAELSVLPQKTAAASCPALWWNGRILFLLNQIYLRSIPKIPIDSEIPHWDLQTQRQLYYFVIIYETTEWNANSAGISTQQMNATTEVCKAPGAWSAWVHGAHALMRSMHSCACTQ